MLKMQGQGGSQDASPDESLPTRWREITEDEAIEIFQAKMNRTGADSTRLALRYGITAKAVRDVWVMRSWITTTMPFWTKEDVLQYLRYDRVYVNLSFVFFYSHHMLWHRLRTSGSTELKYAD